MKERCGFKRVLCMFVMAVLCSAMFAGTAMAASKTVNMKSTGNGTYAYQGDVKNPKQVMYHKIKVTAPSVLVATAVPNVTTTKGTARIWLCDKNKKSLERTASGTLTSADKTDYAAYGVKKGTYYIKTQGMRDYMVVAGVKKWTDKGGTSKGKALNVKSGKGIKGMMPVGEKYTAADWYKFKVTKKRVLQLAVETEANGPFQFYLYGPSYPKGVLIDSMTNKEGSYQSINALTRRPMAVKTGTYYIKVIRDAKNKSNQKSSGIYQFMWKMK